MKAEKVFVIGLDGMDPSLTKKYMDAGLLPNIKKSSMLAPAARIWCC